MLFHTTCRFPFSAFLICLFTGTAYAQIAAPSSPWSLDTGMPFAPAAMAACDMVPDLGPDVLLCVDSAVVFDAGNGFATYRWQDSSANPTFTATLPGIYWVEVTDTCGNMFRDSVLLSFSLLTDTRFPDTVTCPDEWVVYAAPGFDTYTWAPAAGLSCTNCPQVLIQPNTTTTYTLLATNILGCELRDTFVVAIRPLPMRTDTIWFCPGDTVVITGLVFTQPGTFVDTLPGAGSGACDTLRTYNLIFEPTPQPSAVSVQCPGDISVTIPAGPATVPVNYASVIAGTDCPCGEATATLLQGFMSGAGFPVGQTPVCYRATDYCGNSHSCCFTVTVEQKPADPDPCDVKNTPCVKFELLGIFQNPAKQKTYRMRVTNTCAGPMTYVAFELPDGIAADAPVNNADYMPSSGRHYIVRNPNAAPFPSIRFRSAGPGIANGQSDVFEYTLPPQADPRFIHAVARLEPQAFYETHLNVFGCTVVQTPNKPLGGDAAGRQSAPAGAVEQLTVYPNPAADALWLDIPETVGGLTVVNAWGQVVLSKPVTPATPGYALDLPAGWATGLYQVILQAADGRRWTARFVLQR